MSDTREEPADGGGRTIRLVIGVFLVSAVLLALGAGCWYYLHRRAYLREAEAVGRLNHKLAIEHQALTDAEFEQAIALTDSTDWEVRMTALSLAAASVRGWGDHPPRPSEAGRVAAIAARLLSDPDTRVRRNAVRAIGGLGAKEYVEQVRPLTRATDPHERRTAEEAVQRLDGLPNAESPAP